MPRLPMRSVHEPPSGNTSTRSREVEIAERLEEHRRVRDRRVDVERVPEHAERRRIAARTADEGDLRIL